MQPATCARNLTIDMNYNWTNNAYWLLRLRLKPGAGAEVRSIAQAAWQADALVGQSRSPNIVPFHMFGIVSLQDASFLRYSTSKNVVTLQIGIKGH